MASLKKLFAKKEEPKPVKSEVVQEGLRCECGEPVATELGQTSVCVKHMRTN